MRLECQKLIELHVVMMNGGGLSENHDIGKVYESLLIRKIERSDGYLCTGEMIWDDLKKASAERFKRMIENSSLTEIEQQIVELINLYCWIDSQIQKIAKEKWGM